jgi:hypothetical protein
MNDIYQNFIGGDLVPSTASHHTSVYNPSSGKVIAQARRQRRAIRDRTVKVTKNAFRSLPIPPVIIRRVDCSYLITNSSGQTG